MKTRIEVSCVEENLSASLCEVRKLVDAMKMLSIELEVFHDINRSQTGGKSYITVTNQSSVNELLEIYSLKKKIRELQVKPETTP